MNKKSMNQRYVLTAKVPGASIVAGPVPFLLPHPNASAIIVRVSGAYTADLPAGLTQRENMIEWIPGF
jgi:hypothetical protein